MKKHSFKVLIGCMLLLKIACAQDISAVLTDPETYVYTLKGEKLPQLSPHPNSHIDPSYSFFWIFEDDGTFSFLENATHQFNGTNNYVCMEATPRYTPINRLPNMICVRPDAPQIIVPTDEAQNPEFPFQAYSESIRLQSSRDPFHKHERTIILSYENPYAINIYNAEISLYFNSEQTSFYQDNDVFRSQNQIVDGSNNPIAGIKAYNGEKILTSDVVTTTSNQILDRKIVISIPEIAARSVHNLFFRFRTNAISGEVNMEAHFLSTETSKGTLDQTTNLNQNIVSAYDPNKIIVDKKTICYDEINSFGEELTYTVHFQNEGDGPTNGLQVTWPFNHDLKIASLQHKDSKFDIPDLIWRPNEVLWDFVNLGLPGTQQAGYECDQEATKGWLQFKIDTYSRHFYQSTYGPEFTLLNFAIIIFPGISNMKTLPASTFLTEDCKGMKNQLYEGTWNKQALDKGSLKIVKAFKTNNNQLSVHISNDQMEALSIRLLNSMGQIIYREKIQVYPNTKQKINIPLYDTPNGLYILSIGGGKNSISKKIIL